MCWRPRSDFGADGSAFARARRAIATARGPFALALGAVPAAAVPVASLVGPCARNNDLVAHAGPDLVIATGAAIDLVGFVGLHVPHLEAVVGFRPVVRAHATVTVSPSVDGPARETRCEG